MPLGELEVTKNRIELHTIILAFLCTSAVALIGRQTLLDYQQVKEERNQLVLKNNICQLIEVAPYASWFRSAQHHTNWFNQAYLQQFDEKGEADFLQQLITTEQQVTRTLKPMVQVVAVTEGRGKGAYTVLAYPVYDDQQKFVGVGGVAIRDAAINGIELKNQPNVYDVSGVIRDDN